MKRKQMIEFLANHFRYDTMNSWNAATSYAANVKVYNFVPEEFLDAAYNLTQCSKAYDAIDGLIRQFAERYDYRYQIWFNGRSGGYLVLGQGGCEKKVIYPDADFKADNGYNGRAYADGYGWKSKAEAKKAGLLNKTVRRIYTQPGKGLDMERDYEDWTTDDLKERVALVKDFDETVEQCKAAFLAACKIGCHTETIYEPKQVMRLNE